MSNNNKLDRKKLYYINTFDKKLEDFQNDLASKNFQNIKKFGHKIKGSGKSFGFEEISEIGKKIENCSSKNDIIALENFYQEMKILFNTIKIKYNYKK